MSFLYLHRKQYISYKVDEPNPEKQEIIVAMLQDFGFDGFEQTVDSLIANGYKETLDEAAVDNYLKENEAVFSKSMLEEENWNKMWESDFHPIIIEDFCAVRAGFHHPITNVKYEVIITPKMSFGTGHHATTWMMMKAMESIDFTAKTVIDFGTGTGLLAILAEKMGAESIAAIDYDDWCIENGNENIVANNSQKVKMVKADIPDAAPLSDVVLANINKHIILANIESLKKLLNKDGLLLISGILKEDENDIVTRANQLGLKLVTILERNGWLCIRFQHAA
jgi:ribosomal protein L11 methyltransferase